MNKETASKSKEELISEIAALSLQIEQLKNQFSAINGQRGSFLSLEQVSDAVFITDTVGKFLDANTRALSLIGYSIEELRGMRVGDIIDSNDLAATPLMIEEVAGGKEIAVERRLVRKNGSIFYAEISSKAIGDGRLEAIVRDVSEQKRLLKELEESEFRCRTLSESAFEAMAIHDNGIIVEANKAFARLFGFDNEKEVIGLSIFKFASEESKKLIKEKVENNNQEPYEAVGIKKDGTKIFAEIIGKTIPYKNKLMRAASVRDITRQKNIEEALKKSEERYRLLFNKNPLPMWVYDPGSYKILAVNEAAVKHYGYSAQQFLSMTLFDLRSDEEKSRLIKHHASVKHSGEKTISHGLWRHRKKDGTFIDVEVTTGILETETPKANLAVISDVTEKLKIATELSHSEEKFHTLSLSAPIGIFLTLPDGRHDFVNKKFREILSLQNKQIRDEDLNKMIHPDDRERVMTKIERIVMKDQDYFNEFRMIVNGEVKWVRVNSNALFSSSGSSFGRVGTLEDITEVKTAEKQLRSSEEKFTLLSNSAPIGIFLADAKGYPYYINKKFEEITGLPYGRIINNSWQRLIHPADAAHVINDINQTIAEGRDYAGEFRVKNYLKGLRWVKFQATVIKSEKHSVSGWVGTIEDVTDYYESENKYRQLFENNTAGVFRTSVSGEVFDCNEAFVKIMGYPSRDKIKKTNARSFYFDEQDRIDFIHDLRVHHKLNNYQLRIKTFAGEERYVLANVSFYESAEAGSYIEGTLIDITQSIKAENALRENERILSTLMNNLPGMAYRCKYDDTWTMDFVSQGCFDVTGYKPEDLVNNHRISFSSIVHPEDRHAGKDEIIKAIGSSAPFEIEYRIITATGETKWVWEKAEGVFDDQGKLVCLEGFITDITERKRHETEIKLGRENYKNLIDTLPVGVLIHDEDGNALFINPAALEIMGIRSLEEFNGFHMFHFVMQEYHDMIRERKEQLKKGDSNLPYVSTKIRRPDGKVIEVECRATPIIYAGKKAIQAVCQDVTYQRQFETEKLRAEIAEESNKKLQIEIAERKNTERILKETQKYTRMLIDSSLDMICASDKQGFITEFNTAAQRTFGFSRDEMLGKHVSVLYSNPKERIRITEKFLYKTGTFAGEVINKKKNGELFTAFLSASVLKNKNGEIIGAMGVSRDISEIKKAEERIRLSEERYRAIYRQAYIGIAQVGSKGEFLQLNDQFCSIVGYHYTELAKKTLPDIMHPDDRGKKTRNRIQHRSDNITTEKRFIHKNKSVIYVSLTTSQVLDSYGRPDYSIVVIQDITEKKKAEEQMRLQAAKLNAIIESSSHIIWTVDRLNRLTSYNRNYDDWVKEFYKIPVKVGQAINKGKMVSSREYNNFWNKKYKAAFEGQPQHFETFITDKKGNTFWREIYLNPIFDNGGLVKEVSGIGHDITEKKFAEEKIKQSLHEKEVLLKEVHHRVKNNLQVISSILNLQSSYVRDKNTLVMLKESQNRIKSMAFIHESLYQTKDFSHINFSEYVTNLSRNLVHSYEVVGGTVELRLDIENIFLNLDQSIPCGLIINELITNSLKYAFRSRKRGMITVTVKKRKENLHIAIADNGIGFPKKVDYRNTESLGLQLVVTLTEQLNGKIKLDRTKGTKFTIIFKQQ